MKDQKFVILIFFMRNISIFVIHQKNGKKLI